MADEEKYLIWSHEHGAWWRPNNCGYTVHVIAAGRYSRGEALATCSGTRIGWRNDGAPAEIPVREQDALDCQTLVAALYAKTS